MDSRILEKTRVKGVGGIIIAIGLFVLLLFIGTLGFIIIEDYSFVEGLFMTVITMSTVGFREVRPLSVEGMVFTTFLIIFSLGLMAYLATNFTRFIIDGVFRHYFRDNKVKKRINKLKDHVIVCGYGRNGHQAVVELLNHKEKFIIVENNEHTVEGIREDSEHLYIQGDATQDDVLVAAQVISAKALITALPNDSDNLFVVLTAREISPRIKIISRASDEHSDIKLKRAGATNVISPDRIGGQRMAKLVVQPDVVEFIEYIMLQRGSNVKLEELSCTNIADYFVNKTIRELDVRNASGANIVGLRKGDGTYIINPSPDEILSSDDKLFVLGTEDQILALKHMLNRNI